VGIYGSQLARAVMSTQTELLRRLLCSARQGDRCTWPSKMSVSVPTTHVSIVSQRYKFAKLFCLQSCS